VGTLKKQKNPPAIIMPKHNGRRLPILHAKMAKTATLTWRVDIAQKSII
jgi:hypothetical protein